MEVQVTASTNGAQTNPEANIASQILARYRAVAKQYGRFFSEQIYTIVGTNPDLKYKEDVLNDKNTLRKEVTVFLIKPIDITGLKFLPKDFDGEPKIMLNPESNDPNLVFNLVPPQLAKATRDTIADCISRIGKKGGKPIFFSAEELPMLNELLALHNTSVCTFYEELARKYTKLSGTVRSMQEEQERMQVEYARQCGVEPQNSEEVNLNINIEQQQVWLRAELTLYGQNFCEYLLVANQQSFQRYPFRMEVEEKQVKNYE